MIAYTGDGLGHAAHEGNVECVDLRLSHLLVVGVEPQVVRAVASQVVLIASEVNVPHTFLSLYNNIIIIIKINQST